MMLPKGFSGFSLGSKKEVCKETQKTYFIPYISVTCQGEDFIFLLEGKRLAKEQHACDFAEVVLHTLSRGVLEGSIVKNGDYVPDGTVKQ